MLLKNEQSKNEINEEIFKNLETKNEHKTTQNLGYTDKAVLREVHSNTGLPKEDKKVSNKQPNPTSTRTRGTTANKTQSKQKEGNNQDQNRIK